MLEKTLPSEWQQKSEGLLGGASSSIEEETTEEEALDLFLAQLKTLKILTVDAPEGAQEDMEKFAKNIIEKSKEFSKETEHAYSHNNFQAAVTAAITYEPASLNLIGLTTGSGKSWVEAFVIALNPVEECLVIVPNTSLKTK